MHDLDAITARLHEMAHTRMEMLRNRPSSAHHARHLFEDAEALRAAARAIEILRGKTTAMAKPLLACVQIVGPDDLVPAPNGITAIVWANRINAQLARVPRFQGDQPWPRAQACLWPHDAESHAKGPSEDYAWLLKDD